MLKGVTKLTLTLKPCLRGVRICNSAKKRTGGGRRVKSKLNNRTGNLKTSWEPLTDNVSHAWWILLRPQSINCSVRVSFPIKYEAAGRVEAKKIEFFEKKYMHTASWLANSQVWLNRCSFNHQCIIK